MIKLFSLKIRRLNNSIKHLTGFCINGLVFSYFLCVGISFCIVVCGSISRRCRRHCQGTLYFSYWPPPSSVILSASLRFPLVRLFFCLSTFSPLFIPLFDFRLGRHKALLLWTALLILKTMPCAFYQRTDIYQQQLLDQVVQVAPCGDLLSSAKKCKKNTRSKILSLHKVCLCGCKNIALHFQQHCKV